jgi:WD40 repeat protein
VLSAAFSPDGMRVITASYEHSARMWDVLADTGAPEQWASTAERSPFVLEGGVLVRR